jgi:transposase
LKIKYLSEEKKSQVRLLAAKLMEEWQNVDEVAHLLGCRRDFVKHWHQRFREGGLVALQPENAVGRPSILNAVQKAVVKEILFTRNPLEFGFDLALWSNRFVLDLIEMLYKVKLGLPSVNRLLDSFGIATRKPMTAETLKERLVQTKPTRQIGSGKRMCFFHYPIEIDASELTGGLSAASQFVPDRRQSPKRAWVAGAVDARNSKRFMVTYREPIDEQFVPFLERLVHHAGEPIILIINGFRPLDIPNVNDFLAAHTGLLKLYQCNGKPSPDQRTTF